MMSHTQWNLTLSNVFRAHRRPIVHADLKYFNFLFVTHLNCNKIIWRVGGDKAAPCALTDYMEQTVSAQHICYSWSLKQQLSINQSLSPFVPLVRHWVRTAPCLLLLEEEEERLCAHTHIQQALAESSLVTCKVSACFISSIWTSEEDLALLEVAMR